MQQEDLRKKINRQNHNQKIRKSLQLYLKKQFDHVWVTNNFQIHDTSLFFSHTS